MTTIYCIVDSPATDEQYAAAIESSDTTRKSLDETKCVLKWQGDTPDAFSGLTIYTHAEILPIMHSDEWTSPDPYPPGND